MIFAMNIRITLSILIFLICVNLFAENKVKRLSDVVYDHRGGVALIMDVLIPEKQNGIAVFRLMSGGWMSYRASACLEKECQEFTDRGETVFLVSHGSQPRYKVPEIVDQIQRAIRFVRYHADRFGVDPNRFGIMGGSSGGHLAVSAGVHGRDGLSEADYRKEHALKDQDLVDSVNLVSGKVQAVACICPPTNFVNYHHPDSLFSDYSVTSVFLPAFFRGSPPREKQIELFRQSSPYFYVTSETAPILIFHGTKDPIVPYSQSVRFVAKLAEYGVPHRLITKENEPHGWPYDRNDDLAIIEWFERFMF